MDPVPLTEEQINSILDALPDPPGVGKFAISISKRHTVGRLNEVLKYIKVVPLQEAFEEFKKDIIDSIYQSFVEPGRSVGVEAGTTLGGPITQLSLNSFHFAGTQSGVALTFKKVNDLLTGSKMNRSPQMTILFKKPNTGRDLHDVIHTGTFESIMALRPEFEQTTVADVVSESEILNKEEATAVNVSEMKKLHQVLRPERFSNFSTEFTYVLELTLNTYRMYTHKITMQMVAEAIEGPSPPDIVSCVWESQFAGKMYVLVNEQSNLGQLTMNQDTAVLIFFNQIIIKSFHKWKISGITDIEAIHPKSLNIVQGIHRVTTINNIHKVYTTHKMTRWDGVSLGDIRNLFVAAGFLTGGIGEENKENLFITVEFESDPVKELIKRIEDAEQKEVEIRTQQEHDILKASKFHYIETTGNNMNEILWRDDIDVFRTISNDPHEIQNTLGIDAARLYLIFKFSQTLLDFGAYVNQRHISLIFDLFTNLGIINSLSFAGISRTKIGPLALATIERSLDVFTIGSIFGERESTVGVSSSIFLGQQSKRIGTGSIQIEEDHSIVPKERPAPKISDIVIEEGEIDEKLIIGTDFTDMFRKRLTPQQSPAMLTGSIDKSTFGRTAIITDGILERNVPNEVLIPSSRRMTMASSALFSALNKVVVGTGSEVSVEKEEEITIHIGDVSESNSDIRLLPGSPKPNVDILSSLINVSTNTPLPITSTQLMIPEPNTPLQRVTPGGPIEPFSLTVAVEPISIKQESIRPTPVKQVLGRILDDLVPTLEPVPNVGTPTPPRKVQDITTVDIVSDSDFISSFLRMLPIANAPIISLTRNIVKQIVIENVILASNNLQTSTPITYEEGLSLLPQL